MNQDFIKEKLLQLKKTDMDFTLILTGKASKKVNGLYKPATKEILLHNRNFTNDNQVMYTAIHEYAHHLRHEAGDHSVRCHNVEFWALFNTLLDDAEDKRIYERIRSEELSKKIEVAKQLQAEIICLEQKLGMLLLEIQKGAEADSVRFEDVIQHDLQLSMQTTKEMCLLGQIPSHVTENISIDAVSQLVKAKGNQKVIEAIQYRKSIAQIKKAKKKDPGTRIEALERDRARIEKTILMLKHRLTQIIEELNNPDENIFNTEMLTG